MIFEAKIGPKQVWVGLLGVIQVNYPQPAEIGSPGNCSLRQAFFRVLLEKMVQRIDFVLFDKSHLRGLDDVVNRDHLEHVARVIERLVAALSTRSKVRICNSCFSASGSLSMPSFRSGSPWG